MKTPSPTPLALLLLLLAGCGSTDHSDPPADDAVAAEAPHPDGTVTLSAEQIEAAGIRLARPTLGGAPTIELPATIEGDPERTQIVSAAIGGRVVALSRNLGEPVRRGQTLAAIESREAAQLNGAVEAARARLALATSNLQREQRLFAEKVSPEQDLVAARTAATEARIALAQARSQVSAAGSGGGRLNRIGIVAPISGRVIARPVVLGQTVAADAELFRVADLSQLSLSLNLQPADAARLRTGAPVSVRAAGREAGARIRFISPALDPETGLVPAIAALDNRSGMWRVGEPVTASVRLAPDGGAATVQVPSTAIQTIDGKPAIFVRTASGFRAAPVAVGGRSGGQVIVRSGLTGSEQIATTGSFTLKAELGKGEAADED